MNRTELDQILETSKKNGTRANLEGAYLVGADLRGANLVGAKLPGFQIPQEGGLIVWKKRKTIRRIDENSNARF